MKGHIEPLHGEFQTLGHGLEHTQVGLVRNEPLHLLHVHPVVVHGLLDANPRSVSRRPGSSRSPRSCSGYEVPCPHFRGRSGWFWNRPQAEQILPVGPVRVDVGGEDLMAPSPRVRTAAPAPSPHRMQVVRSFQLRVRVMISEATTRTRLREPGQEVLGRPRSGRR